MSDSNETTKVDTLHWIDQQVAQNVSEFATVAIDEFNKGGNAQTPRRMLDILNVLIACSNLITVQLGALEVKQAKFRVQNRERFNSDKQTDQYWLLTDEGLKQHDLKTKLKVVTETIRGCRKTLNFLEMEVKNQI